MEHSSLMYSVFTDLLFFLSVYGIATIISSEYIFMGVIDKFKKYEKLYYLLTCNKCMSVWVGFFVSLLYHTILHPVLDAAVCYVVTSGLNQILDDETSEIPN